MATDTDVDLRPARDALARMGDVTQADLLPLFHQIQDAYGYLPKPVLELVAEESGIPLSHVAGVATFYDGFSLEPRGKHLVCACSGMGCHVRGGARIAEAIERHLGIREGETTPDMQFTFQSVTCLGLCFQSPAMTVDSHQYGRLTPDKVGPVLDQYRSRSTPGEEA